MIDALRSARVFDLEHLRSPKNHLHPGHVPPGFGYTLHRRHEPGLPERRTSASGVLVTSEHAGTHIDALCHQAEDLKVYGDKAVDAKLQTAFGFTSHGVDSIAPIVTRGVLIDVARHLGVDRVAPRTWIDLDVIEAAASAQGVSFGPGDVVLVRTGNGRVWDDSDSDYLYGAGMAPEVSEWVAAAGVLAVGADNMAWDLVGENHPRFDSSLPGHVILLVRNGIHILENLALEELAAADIHEFAFICLPLKIRGATGSPVRPLALA